MSTTAYETHSLHFSEIEVEVAMSNEGMLEVNVYSMKNGGEGGRGRLVASLDSAHFDEVVRIYEAMQDRPS